MTSLPSGPRWLIAGDWNMVLHEKDKSNLRGQVAGAVEQLAFGQFTAQAQVTDFFNYANSFFYSWDNKQSQGPRSLLRLDRVYSYLSSHGNPSAHILEYAILGNSVVSDHLPVTIIVEVQASQTIGARYKMNNHYLKDKSVVDQLVGVWRDQPAHLGFFGKLRHTVKWYRVFCRRHAEERQAEEHSLRVSLASAHHTFQSDPGSEHTQSALSTATERLQSHEDWKI
jgi:hypothetical protein